MAQSQRSLFSTNLSGLAGTPRIRKGARMAELVRLEIASGDEALSKREASVDVDDLRVSMQVEVGSNKEPQTEAPMAAEKKKRNVDEHWVAHFLVRVNFDYNKLPGVSQKAVDRMEEFPSQMWQCRIPHLYTGTGKHADHFLLNPDRPFHQNVIDHFSNAHGQVFRYMSDAMSRGEAADAAAAACLKMFQQQSRKSGGTQSTLKGFVRTKGEQPSAPEDLLVREKKEVALALWLLATQSPLYRLTNKTWNDVQKEFAIKLHNAKELRYVHYPLIFEAILRLRQDLFAEAGFIHAEFDFLTVHNKSILIIGGHTCVRFRLFSDIIGIVEFVGPASADHVAQMADDSIARVAPKTVLLASNTVDGALRAASRELVGEDDTAWCICHQYALPIKKSLNLERFPASLVALDFAFMHDFGVYVRSQGSVRELLDRLREERLGPNSERQILLDCLARWESEHRKLKRFLELKMDLIALSKDADVAQALQQLKDKGRAPSDAFKPKFFERLEAMSPVITLLHQVTKASQSESTVTISAIPFFLLQIKRSLVRVEDEPEAVAVWKQTLLGLVEEQFGDLNGQASNMWAAAALDPRFGDLTAFGVSKEVQDTVWEQICYEHINFKTTRARLSKNDESYVLPSGQVTVAKGHLETLREEMAFVSKPFVQKLLSGAAKVDDIDPLMWWKEQAAKGQTDDNFGQYAAIAPTACLLLSAPGNTATSERGVGRLRRTATPYRNMLCENMLEQEVICSHFINSQWYNYKAVLQGVAKVQAEVEKKKKT